MGVGFVDFVDFVDFVENFVNCVDFGPKCRKVDWGVVILVFHY